MKLTLCEPKYFKDSISMISEIVNEATFTINQDGLALIAMDPANVAMVVFELLSTCFSEFEIGDGAKIGLNLNNLKQILRRIKSNDVLSLETADNKLKITLMGNSTRTFFLPMIDIEENEQKIPNLSFPLKIETSSQILQDAIGDVDIVAESVSFLADANKFLISAHGDLSQAKIEFPSNESTKISSENQDKVKSKYSTEYLKKMIEGSKLASNVVINFSNDYPLKLEYKMIDKFLLTFILAPRVESD